jgi:hypothetical protein
MWLIALGHDMRQVPPASQQIGSPMTGMGHLRRFGCVRAASGLAPIADPSRLIVSLPILEGKAASASFRSTAAKWKSVAGAKADPEFLSAYQCARLIGIMFFDQRPHAAAHFFCCNRKAARFAFECLHLR